MEGTTTEYYQEQIEHRIELLKKLELIYNKTHKEIRKHQTMLDYYRKQLGYEQSQSVHREHNDGTREEDSRGSSTES